MAPISNLTQGQVLNALAALTCNGVQTFSLAGCTYQGTLCSNAGTCSSNGVCSCNSGRDGQYCESYVSNGLSGGDIAGIVVGIVFAIILLVILVIVPVIVVVVLMRGRKVSLLAFLTRGD